jgi:hypothetical protein
MAKVHTHYDNLQVSRQASAEVIRAAYRQLSQKYHPDKSAEDNAEATRKMTLINEAYAILSDPVARQSHNEWIKKEEAGNTANETGQAVQKTSVIQTFEYLIFPNRKVVRFNIMLSLVFVSGGIWMANDALMWGGLAKLFAIYLVLPVFGLGAVSWAYKLVNPAPTIIVTESGINVRRHGGVNLRWNEILDFRVAEPSKGARYLAIVLRDQQSVYARLPKFWQLRGFSWLVGADPARSSKEEPAIYVHEDLLNKMLERHVKELRTYLRV